MDQSSNEPRVIDGTPLTPMRYGRSIGKTSSLNQEKDPEEPIYSISATGQSDGGGKNKDGKNAHSKPMDIRRILRQQQRQISASGSKGAGNYQDTSDVGAPNDEHMQ